MSHTILVLLVINLLVLAALLWRQWRLRAELLVLRAQCAQLGTELQELPADLQALLGRERPMLLSIEILNPIEVAAQHSSLAGTFGNLTPGLLRRIVYERTQAIMASKLGEFGIRAEVRLHRAA
jgi:hypothetical protein